MKKKLICVGLSVMLAVNAFAFTACGNDKSTRLGEPKPVEGVDSVALSNDDYKTFKSSVEEFAADFAAYSYSDDQRQDNFAVSPISVYMALALSAECAAGDTRTEILRALGVTHQQLQTHFSTLYRSLAVENKADDQTTSLLDLSNSVWVNKGTQLNQSCIETLSNDYYAYSYSADFEQDNKGANKAVRDFVKKQTKGLIDKDFELSDETLFTLINTLYLKTVWNTDGEDLPFASGEYPFTAKDGSVKNVQLLQGYYFGGRAVAFDTFKTFYTQSHDGYKIKFLLPKDGYSLDEVFTSENLAAVNAITDYGAYDESAERRYATRVLFPEYKCKYDEDIVEILQKKFGIDLLFKDHRKYSPACDFSTLSGESCYCNTIRHVTDLTVNKKGIEGAAVTVAAFADESAEEPPIYEDFVVNRSFGFILTDPNDVTLFSGVVNDI